ncbi:MAG: hypothetical protein K1X29_03840 [Bdellovibrionales bacterium]|nr:hypothetical protein [Bdellovibrionales bacterium]
MKYFSLIIILFMMGLSWRIHHFNFSLTEQTHMELQDELKKLITDYVQQQLPNSQNLQFNRFWTETVNNKKIKASFIYSFEDDDDDIGKAQVEIEGYAILNQTDEHSSRVSWSLDTLVVSNNNIEFKEPLTVKAGEDSLETNSEETSQENIEDNPDKEL